MELEQLQAELEEAKSAIESLSSKNKELIAEKRKLQAKTSEVDVDAYHKAIEELDTTKDALAKLKKQYETDTKKLGEELSKKDSYLTKTMLSDGLKAALLEAGVDKDYLSFGLAMLEKQGVIKQNGDAFEPFINDKPMKEYVSEWMQNDGKLLTRVNPEVSAAAHGGTSGTQTKSFADMNETERTHLFKTDPEAFKSELNKLKQN